MKAYELLARIYAGLVMTTVDGKLDWIGTAKELAESENIINYFETFV